MPKAATSKQRDAYEAVFSALAHPARRRMCLAVYFNGGAMSAGEVAAMFAHAWQTTTRHLQVLESSGLLSHQRQGRMRIYRLERKPLQLVSDWLSHFQEPVKLCVGGTKDARYQETNARKEETVKARSA